jgi:hypothetical protein
MNRRGFLKLGIFATLATIFSSVIAKSISIGNPTIPVISSLDKVHTNEIVAYIRRKLEWALSHHIGRVNDKHTRYVISLVTAGVLNQCRFDGLIDQYILICDETNNPPSIIDNHQLKVFVRFNLRNSVEWINMNFIVGNV